MLAARQRFRLIEFSLGFHEQHLAEPFILFALKGRLMWIVAPFQQIRP